MFPQGTAAATFHLPKQLVFATFKMNLSNLTHVHVVKYRSKIKRLPLFGHCSEFIWSPSSCLYPNDCFYFDPDYILSPLPEFVFKSRFSYSRFKKGKPHFRHLQSASDFTATTLIMSPSPTEIDHECLESLLCPSPLRTIEQLNADFEFLNLSEEKLDLEEELFQYKKDQAAALRLRSRDSESPISRISDHRSKSRLIYIKGYSDPSPSAIESVADLVLESPLSRSQRVRKDNSLVSLDQCDPVSRVRTSQSPAMPGKITDAATQTGTDFEDSFGQKTIGTQTSD